MPIKPDSSATRRARIAAYYAALSDNGGHPDWFDPFEDVTTRRRRRRTSIRRVMREAKKAGVDSVTLPDGTMLHLGETAATTATTSELDEWMAKHAHQA